MNIITSSIILMMFFQDYQAPLFGQSLASQKRDIDVVVSQALCLPVSVHELIENNLSSVVSLLAIFSFLGHKNLVLYRRSSRYLDILRVPRKRLQNLKTILYDTMIVV